MPTQRRVAVIDDHKDSREDYAGHLRMAGFEPIIFAERINNLNVLMQQVSRARVDYALCDHRLSEEQYAPFSGAKAMRIFYEHKLPALLITEWRSDDIETTIRPSRRWIPRLMQSTDARHTIFQEGFETVHKEVIDQQIPAARKGYRAILRKLERVRCGNYSILRVGISQWRLGQPVGLPESMLPVKVREHLDSIAFLYATVNIAAESSDDIYFENFELPHPDDLGSLPKT